MSLLLSSCLQKSPSPTISTEEQSSVELPEVVEQELPDSTDTPTPNLDQIQEISTESEPTSQTLPESQDTSTGAIDQESNTWGEEEQIDEELAQDLENDIDNIQEELDILFDLVE